MMTADPRMVKKGILVTGTDLYRGDGAILFWRQGDLSANHDPGLYEEDTHRYQKYFRCGFGGTIIQHDCKASSLPIKGISSINDISIINVKAAVW